jgi:hypothetical protein
MSIAVMVTEEDLPQLEYIANLISQSNQFTPINSDSLRFVTNAIGILKGSYKHVPFPEEPSH